MAMNLAFAIPPLIFVFFLASASHSSILELLQMSYTWQMFFSPSSV